jgi:hypothetical protein
MLSNIEKMEINENSIKVWHTDGTSYECVVNVRELIKNKRTNGLFIAVDSGAEEAMFQIVGECYKIIVDGEVVIAQFFPHDMQRCIIKDLNKDRQFDLAYRKHLVYDYSKDHFNIIFPYQVPDKTKEKAIKILREHSTGKNSKPTGIVLDFKLIVVKGDSNYSYDL